MQDRRSRPNVCAERTQPTARMTSARHSTKSRQTRLDRPMVVKKQDRAGVLKPGKAHRLESLGLSVIKAKQPETRRETGKKSLKAI